MFKHPYESAAVFAAVAIFVAGGDSLINVFAVAGFTGLAGVVLLVGGRHGKKKK